MQLAALNFAPKFRPRTLVSTEHTTRRYRFANFHHPYLCSFAQALDRRGIDELLSLETQTQRDASSFDAYAPTINVLKSYPVDEVDFQSDGAYSIYNWELFFHIPLLIATRLQQNQRFRDAQRWFHYIFDPTVVSGGPKPQDYWRTKPFHERLADDYADQAVEAIEMMIASGMPEDLIAAVLLWRRDPFNPHAIARLRGTAYQKAVVMKYIDNLLAWGDQLFRRETLESINEATQLYVLAAEILGRRPEVVDRKMRPAARTFNSIEAELGALGNAVVDIELLVADSGVNLTGIVGEVPNPPSSNVLLFCVPENDKLLGYWDTVADRLTKIRNCMNIEGQVRQLPLFEPPIDPALLVRAQAAGLSIAEVLSEIVEPALPHYRFAVMLQKANELVAEVRSLGAALLAALEKKDSETLLQAMREVRQKQVHDAVESVASLTKGRDLVLARKEFYESREFMSAGEISSNLLTLGTLLKLWTKAGSDAISIPLSLLPDAKAGSPTTIGITFGGSQRGESAKAHRSWLETLTDIASVGATLANTMAGYQRRNDDWKHQANLATLEWKQIERQLTAAEIRLAIAEQELRNHDQQTDNARDVDSFLRGKFTSEDLYQYTVARVSGLYFQSYQLAYELARRAERCMQHELGLTAGDLHLIQFGYWDTLQKGLLAGEHLAYDLRRLEIAYLDGNKREFELTKHISLRLLDPVALLTLKATATCDFTVPEWLFDLDGPGHYMRRIKHVSVSVPAVTGPYTSLNCTLTLRESWLRKSDSTLPDYPRKDADDIRFVNFHGPFQPIVTSSGREDGGLFETNLRDERFLPFEGVGTESTWRLELPAEFRQFDYSTIPDVILHMRYTCRQGEPDLRRKAVSNLTTLLTKTDKAELLLHFSLKHDFPTEWQRFVTGNEDLKITVKREHFPYLAQIGAISLKEAQIHALVGNEIKSRPLDNLNLATLNTTLQLGNGGQFDLSLQADDLLKRDREAIVFLVFRYHLG